MLTPRRHHDPLLLTLFGSNPVQHCDIFCSERVRRFYEPVDVFTDIRLVERERYGNDVFGHSECAFGKKKSRNEQ